MKKITIFIFTILTVATLFAAARPSLDGRAVVAESGTMPRGLFARTVGYLPGDSVSVTNPATGSTVDVLILGAIDPSEGVAILLSPEAAASLKIRPNSNVQVKLTKRSGNLDENANGSAVISSSYDYEMPKIEEKKEIAKAPESAPVAKAQTPPAKEEKPLPKEEPAVEEIREPEEITEVAQIAEPEEEEIPESQPVITEVAKNDDLPPVEEPMVNEEKPLVAEIKEPETFEAPVEEAPVQKNFIEEKVLPKEKPVKKEKAVVIEGKEEVAQTFEEEEEPATVYEILPPLPNNRKIDSLKNKEKVVVIDGEEADYEEKPSEVTPISKTEEKAVTISEPVEEEKAQPAEAEVAKTEEEAPVEEKAELDEIAQTEEETPVEEKAELDEIAQTEEEVPVEEKAELDEIAQTEEETPVEEKAELDEIAQAEEEAPVEEKAELDEIAQTENLLPPEVEEEPCVALEEEGAKTSEIVEADAFQPIVLVPAEPNPPVAEEKESEEVKEEIAEALLPTETAVPAEETAPKIAISNDWTNYVVPSVKNLRSGSYYIQVASLGNTENIKSFVDKYSTKYPVVIVQTSSKKAYNVMVGPLNIDEYGAVDEKFKSNGFKDAFVRKIK